MDVSGLLSSGGEERPSRRSTGRRLLDVRWTAPPNSVIKVNIDGASKGNPGRVAAMCVLWDQDGHWIVGGSRSLGYCTSLHAELWAVLLGLQLAWDHGFRSLILETDSQLVFGLLTRPKPFQLAHDALVSKCASFLSRDWEVTVSKIYREANFAGTA